MILGPLLHQVVENRFRRLALLAMEAVLNYDITVREYNRIAHRLVSK